MAIRDVNALRVTYTTRSKPGEVQTIEVSMRTFVRKLAYLLLSNLDEHELRARLAESLDPADVDKCFRERDMTLTGGIEVLAALCRDRLVATAVLTCAKGHVRTTAGEVTGENAIAMAGACATLLARADDDVSVDGVVVANDGDVVAALASRRVWLTVFQAMFRREAFGVDVGAVAAFARFMKRP